MSESSIKGFLTTPFVLAAVLGACAAPQTRLASVEADPAAAPVEPAPTAENVGGASVEAQEAAPGEPQVTDAAASLEVVSGSAPQEASARPTQDERMAIMPRGFWNDPTFQRRFRESYMSETDVEPPVTFEERGILEEVLGLTSDGDFEGAIELLDDEQDEQSSAVFDQIRGNIGFETDDMEMAVRGYEAAVDRFPKFRRAWKNLGLIHTRNAEHADAARALTKVVELGGADSLTYGALGAAYLSLENSVAAESAFRMAVLLEPAEVQWQLGLARAFFNQRRYAEASALCGTLIASDPSRPDFWLLQANALVGMNEPLDAAENLVFVSRLGAADADSMLLLGDIYTNQDLFDLANEAYFEALELGDETYSDRLSRSARLMIAKESYDEAKALLTALDEALGEGAELEERQDLLNLQAQVAVAQGDGATEVATLERLVDLDPTDGTALVLLGKYRQRTDEPEAAELLFDRAIALEDHVGEASLAKAQLLVSMERFADAVPLIRTALSYDDRQVVRDYLDSITRLAGRSAGN